MCNNFITRVVFPPGSRLRHLISKATSQQPFTTHTSLMRGPCYCLGRLSLLESRTVFNVVLIKIQKSPPTLTNMSPLPSSKLLPDFRALAPATVPLTCTSFSVSFFSDWVHYKQWKFIWLMELDAERPKIKAFFLHQNTEEAIGNTPKRNERFQSSLFQKKYILKHEFWEYIQTIRECVC